LNRAKESPMSRRKHLAARNTSGKIVRHTELASPTAIRRLTDAAIEGLRDASFATMLGRLYLREKISAGEFGAGKRWAALTADYAVACQAPRPPQTARMDPSGGISADPDSELGRREAKEHEAASAAYVNGKNALRLAGRNAEAAVEAVCVLDQACTGFDELKSLREGLSALSALFVSKRMRR
jgi:hypothetical protein